MRRTIIGLALLLLLITGCSSTGKDDSEKVARQIEQAVQATLAAQASVTSIPTRTPVPATAMSNAASPEPLSATQPPEPTTASTSTLEPTPSSTPAATSTSTDIPTATPITEPRAKADRVVNLRTGPGTNYPVAGSMKVGDVYNIVGRTADRSWLQVCCVGETFAWVAASVVSATGDLSTVRLVQDIPTPPPAPPTSVVVPTEAPMNNGRGDVEVTWINPHYECEQREWTYRGDLRGLPGVQIPLWGYRQFQIDMFIKNNSDASIPAPWHPTRWIITNGREDSILDLWWVWTDEGGQHIAQGPIPPGQTAGWTFMAFPLDRDQWVKAVEYIWNGHTYRHELDLGPLRNNDNYKDCGEPAPHTVRPTPTPRPLS